MDSSIGVIAVRSVQCFDGINLFLWGGNSENNVYRSFIRVYYYYYYYYYYY
jgi:hypothetical protein